MNRLNKVFSSNIKAIDDVEQTLTALISTNAVDRMDEVLDPKGVDLKNFKNNPVVLWAHDYAQQPIGKALWTKRSGDGIISKIKFANTQFAQEVFELYKGGFLSAFSVGFIPKEHEDEDVKGQGFPRRKFTKWELLEFSAVPVPANPEALALAMSKGMVKSNELIKALNKGDTDDTNDEDFHTEEGSKKEKTKEVDDSLDDLIADNDQLTKRVELLECELRDLRYKLYEKMQENEVSVPEITDEDLAQKAADTVARVIRKVTGKLD